MLFDFDALPPVERYKLLTATVTPRPIAWVVSLDAEGRRNAAPYSFFNALSGDPPLVGVSVGRRPGGGTKDTRANVEATGEFVVNLVSAAAAEAMNVTAIEFDHAVDELEEAKLTTIASTRVRPPRIAESPVALECVLHQALPLGEGGSNTLLIGRVVAMHVRDDAVLDASRRHIDTPALDLIGRLHGGGWYTRSTDRFEMPRIAVDDWRRRD